MPHRHLLTHKKSAKFYHRERKLIKLVISFMGLLAIFMRMRHFEVIKWVKKHKVTTHFLLS